MTGLFAADGGATPLTPEERNGLIPSNITTRDELNELEQENILVADSWAFGRKRPVVDERFLKALHRRMFEDVWDWAGEYRTTERNLGVEHYRIQVELRQLLGDVAYWIDNQAYPADEIAVRFHHRLVSVHPFPNGNGRWSRMAADLLVVRLGGARFTWGGADLQAAGGLRKTYIAALKSADAHDIGPLLKFARS